MRLPIPRTIASVPPIRAWSPGAQTVLAVLLCFATLAAASVVIAGAAELSAAAETPIALALSL